MFCNKPKGWGVTLAFGDLPQDLLAREGEIIKVGLGPYFKGKETDCLRAVLPEGLTSPNTPHITLSWDEGSAPVVAGKELNASGLPSPEASETIWVDAQIVVTIFN